MALRGGHTSYVLLEGSDLLVRGDRVRLSERGRRVHRYSDPNRIGTVVRRARVHRHFWVVWAGRKRPEMYLDAYLQRVY